MKIFKTIKRHHMYNWNIVITAPIFNNQYNFQIENERDEVKRSRQEEEPVPGDRRFEGAPNPGHRQPLDLSATHFPDPSHHQMSQHPVFLNPMSIPFPGHAPEKVRKYKKQNSINCVHLSIVSRPQDTEFVRIL